MRLQGKPACGPTGVPPAQTKFARAITHNGKDAYKMGLVMNTPHGSMKMRTEGRHIVDACEKK